MIKAENRGALVMFAVLVSPSSPPLVADGSFKAPWPKLNGTGLTEWRSLAVMPEGDGTWALNLPGVWLAGPCPLPCRALLGNPFTGAGAGCGAVGGGDVPLEMWSQR